MATTYNNILIDGLLRLVAQQWATLGVGVQADDPPEAVIDPEALLWVSLEIARYEPRLFDEIIDWIINNHEWFDLKRLRIIGPNKNDIRWRILAAIAEVLHKKKGKWNALRQNSNGCLFEKEPLFLERNGHSAKVIGKPDPIFQSKGLIRSEFETRGQSRPPKLNIPAALLLRTKAIFGVDARAYVLSALLIRIGSFQSNLQEHTGYKHTTISKILSPLVKAKFCNIEKRKTANWYNLSNRENWKNFLELPFFPPWPDWISIFQGLVYLVRIQSNALREEYSEYIFASELRKAFVDVKDKIIRGNIDSPSITPENVLIEDFTKAFDDYFRIILKNSLFLD